MKEKHLKILVIVMTVALIGLIAIQGYWLKSAIALKEQEFKKNVNDALKSTVYKMEQFESYKRVHSNQKIADFLPYSYKEKTIIDTNIQDNRYSFQMEEESIFETADGKIIKKTIQKLKDQNGNTLHQSNGIEQYVGNAEHPTKFDLLNELITDISSFKTKSVLNRIDPHVLNTILKEELLLHGVKTKYNIGIFSGNNLVLKEKGINTRSLIESPYKIRLFPNDFFFNHDHISLLFPQERGFLLRSMGGVISISSVFILLIVVVFWITFNTVVKQKKLALIKNDFINNMTHELKTPISTISLACDILKDDDIPKTKERMTHYFNVITDENRRLGTLVENVLQSAVLDKGEFKLKLQPISLHQTVQTCVQHAMVRIEQKNGVISLDLDAEIDVVDADKVHLTNVISNLIDNAIKYSSEKPVIAIKTKNIAEGIVVEVQDQGIGIAKENVNKIFDKLYRVPTGNLHDVKGFGLGLSYVKAIVDKLQGSIKVASTIGKGSTFSIYLPFKQEL